MATYLVALLATIPAGMFVPLSARVAAVGGTVWHGEAALAGGDRLSWRWAPLRTLANLAFAADVVVTGADTALAGRALLRTTSVRLDDISGSADARLLAAIDPNLSFACAMPLQVNLTTLTLGAGERRLTGEMRSGAGSCGRKGGSQMPVAPLVLTAGEVGRASVGTIAPLGARRLALALARFTLGRDGRLELTVTRAGAAALPFAAPSMGMTLATDF